MSTAAAVVDFILEICIVFLVIHVVISWLIGYRVIGTDNRHVAVVRAFFVKATNPLLWPIRLLSGDAGDVDMSPVFAIVLLLAARYVLKLYPMGTIGDLLQ